MAATARRVLIVEDNCVFAEALATLLGRDARLEVAGIAHDGAEALALARVEEPDVVLVDLGLPAVDGLEVARRVRARDPSTRVIALTGYAEERYAAAAEAGVSAYFTKGDVDERLADAIYEVAATR